MGALLMMKIRILLGTINMVLRMTKKTSVSGDTLTRQPLSCRIDLVDTSKLNKNQRKS